jgi:CBS domain-containing protein
MTEAEAAPASAPEENSIEHADPLLASELERIAALPPFDAIPTSHLAGILAEAEIVFFRHGQIICHPAMAESETRLWLVRRGSVHAMPIDEEHTHAPPAELLRVGALFPLESALSREFAPRVFTTAEDSSLWEISGAVLQRLLSEPAVLRWIAHWLHAANAILRRTVTGLQRSRQAADQALALPARAAGQEGLVCVPAQTRLKEVAELMATRRIGAVVIGVPEAVVGIVTQTDLIRRAIAAGLDYAAPVASIMTPQPAMIDSTTTVLDASLDMARHGFRHLLVREPEGPVVGIVSERDLFHIQLQGIGHVFQPIDAANSVDEIAALASRTREFAMRVFRQGMAVNQFMRLISSINDRLTQRLLTVIRGESASQRDFCWLAFGSEGREEQGFVTDQDNGIVFVPPPSADLAMVRAGYLEMAGRMNQALQHCGFALCKGNIMAGNPAWCLSLDEWKDKFSRWIHATTPTAVLNATIFFDFRGIYGDNELVERLRDHLFDQIAGNTICLHMLAANALRVAPPLGKWNRFKTDGSEATGTLDLKTHGSRLFVDAARVFALAAGARTANTEQRLRAVGTRIRRAPTAIEGDIAAFRFIQTVRLRHQLDSLEDGTTANRLDPYMLNDLDQRMLLESLRQAQSLQTRLKLDYSR